MPTSIRDCSAIRLRATHKWLDKSSGRLPSSGSSADDCCCLYLRFDITLRSISSGAQPIPWKSSRTVGETSLLAHYCHNISAMPIEEYVETFNLKGEPSIIPFNSMLEGVED
ncbi:hypothetical protein NPIL_414461 [Nephila pilipes]|uniref:Uncharacterized protein n=1 Tax=Nephila pilipes TaxID=299642 RepID=A0A8X6TN29_NEPPI|nr:hypothetical protein NPIL_414461 [Nephila pilipes]